MIIYILLFKGLIDLCSHITFNPLNKSVHHMQGKNNSSGFGNLQEQSNKQVCMETAQAESKLSSCSQEGTFATIPH